MTVALNDIIAGHHVTNTVLMSLAFAISISGFLLILQNPIEDEA